jgi:ParB-like chromosome segregation protein Spo0J
VTTWRNRIVGEGEVDPAEVQANPLNWRVHPKIQRETLEDALDTIGWIQRPTINKRSGLLIDGHLRVASAAARGEPKIPVSYVDLSPEEERAALASLDPMAGMAVMDGEKLTELLTDLEIGSGALDAMFDDLREQAEGSTLASAGKTGEGLLVKGSPVVKAVIAVENMNLIEQALAATGQAARGEALLTLCRSFLSEKRQHDAGAQNGAAVLPTQKNPVADRLGDARRSGPGLEAGLQRDPAGSGVRGKAAKGRKAGDAAPDVERVRGGLHSVPKSGRGRPPAH